MENFGLPVLTQDTFHFADLGGWILQQAASECPDRVPIKATQRGELEPVSNETSSGRPELQ
jgi:hypothetical protein